MNIQEWFCVCFFFKLFLVISNADSPPKITLKRTPSGNIDRDTLIQDFNNLISDTNPPRKIMLSEMPSKNKDKDALIHDINDLISDSKPSRKITLKEAPPEKVDKGALVKDINNLIEHFQNAIKVEEKLHDEVVITQGYTTIWEYAKSWLIPGYQPEAIGTAANPLIQHTFKRVKTADGSVPTYGVTEIAPTNTPQVKEPSRIINPYTVATLKKSANGIVGDIEKSPEKVRLA